MAYRNEADEATEVTPSSVRPWRWDWLSKLLIPLSIAGHVLFYDVLPVSLAWVVGSPRGLDLFTVFEGPSLQRVAQLGVFLSGVGALITTESITRLARPFSVGQFLATAFMISAALLPFMAEWHQIRLGLAPEQFALLQSYSYLGLRVLVGILVGATVGWILLASYTPLAPSPRPASSRK
jgi:hypothetical protein